MQKSQSHRDVREFSVPQHGRSVFVCLAKPSNNTGNWLGPRRPTMTIRSFYMCVSTERAGKKPKGGKKIIIIICIASLFRFWSNHFSHSWCVGRFSSVGRRKKKSLTVVVGASRVACDPSGTKPGEHTFKTIFCLVDGPPSQAQSSHGTSRKPGCLGR